MFKREFEKFFFQSVLQDIRKFVDDDNDECKFYQRCIDYFEDVINSVSECASDELLTKLHQMQDYYQKRLLLRKIK